MDTASITNRNANGTAAALASWRERLADASDAANPKTDEVNDGGSRGDSRGGLVLRRRQGRLVRPQSSEAARSEPSQSTRTERKEVK